MRPLKKCLALALTVEVVLMASAAAGEIPFPGAVDSAAVRQDRLDDVLENALILGNGDVNALLYAKGPGLVLRLTKNDVWDSRIDTSMNPPLLKVDIKGKRLIGLGNVPKNWEGRPYPRARLCADVILGPAEGSGPSSQSSVLDIGRAKAVVPATPGRAGATVRALAQRNVFLVEGSLAALLRPVPAGHLPAAETGIKEGVTWLLQKIPGDLDWSGMAYAVAIAEARGVKAVSIVSSYEAEDPVSAAVGLARKTASAELSALVVDHERMWHEFWSASGVKLDDAMLQEIWYRNLYLLRCVSKAGVKAAGIFAGLTTPDPSWPYHWLNYNSQQAFWAAYPANQVALAEPYERMITAGLPRARSFARQIYGCAGAAFPHVLEMLGLTVTTGDIASPENCKSVNGRLAPWPPYAYTIGVAGFAVQNLWLHYKYQPDREHLAQIVYPAIRDVAIFYCDFIDRCEVGLKGKVILAPSYSPENWSLTEDFRYNRNCAFDIAFIRYTLQAGIEAAKVLGRDDSLADRFKTQLQRLPDYPTTKGPDPIVVDVEDAPPIDSHNIPVPTVPIFPGDQITWFSSEAEKRLFARTLDKVKGNGNNSSMMLSVARARLSTADAADWIRAELGARLRPNGTLALNRRSSPFNDMGHYTEQFAASMVVSEMLLQSVGDVLRVFPAWPGDKNARFRNLRAQGGFLVSADFVQGRTDRVKVTATADGVLRLLSPWPQVYAEGPSGAGRSRLEADRRQVVTVSMRVGDELVFLPEPGKSASLSIACREDNDLYRVLRQNEVSCERYDTAAEAVGAAQRGGAVLILADGYPAKPTMMADAVFDQAAEKKLRVYLEYPANVAGLKTDSPKSFRTGPYGVRYDRTVIASDFFGKALPELTILVVQDCHYIPMASNKPHLVLARVAGYNKAVLGLPEDVFPILFEHPERAILISTTKLSHFVTGRYLPTAAWGPIWCEILEWLQAGETVKELKWTPRVVASYGPKEALPGDAQLRAIRRSASWLVDSRLLVHESWKPQTHPTGIKEPIPRDWKVGDGSLGIAEAFDDHILYDGSHTVARDIRADCNTESAMVLAASSLLFHDPDHRQVAQNLNNYTFFDSELCQGPRMDPSSSSYGMIGWAVSIEAGKPKMYFGDDNARCLLATMAAAAWLKSDRWDEAIVRGILANFRTTGPLGFRNGMLHEDEIHSKGWEYFWSKDRIAYSPHYEGYLWAPYLWLYDKTGFKPLLERAKAGIYRMMEAYPDKWAAECGRMEEERVHMLLPLAWLVRVEDTPLHRKWLDWMVTYLQKVQHPCGAIPQHVDTPFTANNQYGSGEAPIVYQTGDPATDMLYTMNFALSGLREAAAATGNPEYARMEERIADFLIRIQTRCASNPELDGLWYRSFDFERWDYWGSDGDLGWGALMAETGWTQSWIAGTLALRQMKTSLWDLTKDSQVANHFTKYRKMMLPAIGTPSPNPVDPDGRPMIKKERSL